MSELITSEAFKIIEGRPVTSSIKVAEYFGKLHKNVIRDIEELTSKKPELRERNFALAEEVKQVGATTRKVPFYWMDRKGFSILAMGFTGAKALDFKCAFYDEFERMEEALRSKLHAADTIDAAQQLAIRRAVAARAKNVSVHYRTIYHALYERFQVPRYTDLRRADFDEALRFIANCEIRHQLEAAPTAPVGGVVFSKTEVEQIQELVYAMKYLFRHQLKSFLQVLQYVNSPMAPRFWELTHNMNLSLLEKTLEKHGFAVTDMDCFKALTSGR